MFSQFRLYDGDIIITLSCVFLLFCSVGVLVTSLLLIVYYYIYYITQRMAQESFVKNILQQFYLFFILAHIFNFVLTLRFGVSVAK